MINNLNSSLRYIGSGEHLPKTAESGDIFTKDGIEYVMSDSWIAIGDISNTEPKKIIGKICSQCGAPLNGNKCEYCGTEYG